MLKKKVIFNYIKTFNTNIVLCCAYCYFKNLHPGHTLLELNDIESIEKYNFTIESSTKESSELLEKIKNLKNKIENEIDNINNLYEKTINDLTNSFLLKHEKLIKEENDIKEKLQIEVTKAKEKLENYLSNANNQIKLSGRINQGVKKLEKEKKIFKKFNIYFKKKSKTKSDEKIVW